jgi:hypothetical protein
MILFNLISIFSSEIHNSIILQYRIRHYVTSVLYTDRKNNISAKYEGVAHRVITFILSFRKTEELGYPSH